MTTIRVPPISRSIPTPIQYQVERIESSVLEFDTAAMTQKQVDEQVLAARRAQQLELDRLDDEVRACYGMPLRKYGYDGRLTPGPTCPHNVPRTTTCNACTVGFTGQPALAPAPVADRNNPGRQPIYGTEPAAPSQSAPLQAATLAKPAPPASPSQYPAGVNMAGAKRLCSHADHKPNSTDNRERGIITIAEWDYSIAHNGKPLCRLHQVRA